MMATPQSLPYHKKTTLEIRRKKMFQNFLKFITISETAQQYYDKALSGTKEGDEDNNNIVVYDEQEPFI